MNKYNININDVLDVAHRAGAEIMAKRGRVKTITKPDGSPVTDADLIAHETVMDGLSPYNIPIISEEDDKKTHAHILETSRDFWLIDPLDGTRSFLDGRDGFGVHIGLVVDGEPVLGVAHFPALNVTYFTGNDGKAYKMDTTDNSVTELCLKTPPSDDQALTVSASWRKSERPSDINGIACDTTPAVGGQRLCHTAEGLTHLAFIDRFFSWWDVAAAHAILKSAGGDLFELNTQKPIRYDDKKLYIDPALGGDQSAVSYVFPDAPKTSRKASPKPEQPKP